MPQKQDNSPVWIAAVLCVIGDGLLGLGTTSGARLAGVVAHFIAAGFIYTAVVTDRKRSAGEALGWAFLTLFTVLWLIPVFVVAGMKPKRSRVAPVYRTTNPAGAPSQRHPNDISTRSNDEIRRLLTGELVGTATQSVQVSAETPIDRRIKDLVDALDRGLLTREEFERAKRAVLPEDLSTPGT